jgi:D-alanyl-D-alanine carboxypeptidase (penicillin-binding protein 5/6)
MDDGGRANRRVKRFVFTSTASIAIVAALVFTPPNVAAAKKKKSSSATSADKAAKPKTKPAAEPKPKEAPVYAASVVDVSQMTGELPILAQGAAVLDAWTGEMIYGRNADQIFYPASTTKILTALLVIESGNLDQELVVGYEEPRVGESSLDLKPGDHFTRRQALYGLMLKSANDVAHALARDNAGSIAAFAEKMNLRARELGATNSHFVNPHGLHNPQHYTTPHDLALIARAAMQQPYFRSIVATETQSWVNGSSMRLLTNHNRLLKMFPGCNGVKTGYTIPAANVLVSSALWGTREVISVVMHTDRPGQWEDSKLLLSYGFAHLPELPVEE